MAVYVKFFIATVSSKLPIKHFLTSIWKFFTVERVWELAATNSSLTKSTPNHSSSVGCTFKVSHLVTSCAKTFKVIGSLVILYIHSKINFIFHSEKEIL